jgi:hypothetical protein
MSSLQWRTEIDAITSEDRLRLVPVHMSIPPLGPNTFVNRGNHLIVLTVIIVVVVIVEGGGGAPCLDPVDPGSSHRTSTGPSSSVYFYCQLDMIILSS